jgi:tRNA(Ile)-lysidine synthase TilS/MesJ
MRSHSRWKRHSRAEADRPGGRVLVALSGRPDSVALLLCMLELQKRDLEFQITAAHLNPASRKDADRDGRSAGNFAIARAWSCFARARMCRRSALR